MGKKEALVGRAGLSGGAKGVRPAEAAKEAKWSQYNQQGSSVRPAVKRSALKLFVVSPE